MILVTMRVFISLSFMLGFLSLSLFAQQAKKPTIMILPSDNWCSARYFTKTYDNQGSKVVSADYRRAFLEDSELNPVISKIGELLTEQGYSLKDAEQAAKSLDTEMAENDVTFSSTSHAGLAMSPLDMLKQRVKSDILIQINWNVTREAITFTMEAFDTYTDKRIATATGTKERNKDIVPVQIESIIKGHIKKFDEQMDGFYQEMQANGREIALNLQVWDNSDVNLETEYNGDELLWHIQEWLSENTVNSQFNLSDATENFARFEQVRIPLVQRGMALDARGFVRGLQKHLQKAPYNITSKIVMQGLGKATLIIGEK
ncbi:hypothetical protein Bacsa_3090 [Phocaeicola salanitronis DSM 18170]|uniref:Lipoprotein n=2 Tax=Phocaeicola salanitronis TaxID=376805 RepID=F0R357_PHOSB|nr:hypothetical protein Bacsa_3090 [Phocaeicola salanitronis DSM 18170]